ncbi:MAG: PHP domain-containing protein [Candidatus Thorarchaeota archaeon]
MKMSFPRINLHIHSNFSDGKNNIKQIIKGALLKKLDFVAITDHFTDSWKEWVSKLKDRDKLTEYLTEISICQNYVRDKKKKLTILKGIEIDLSSSENFIKLIKPDKFDLILFEYLQNIEGIAFVKNIINFWKGTSKNIGKFPILGLAHFDPSYFIYENLDILVSFLKEYDIYFEFNPSYPNFYARKNQIFFDKLKKANIPVAIGCDSHSIKSLNNIEEPLEIICNYNLEDNFLILIKELENKFNLNIGNNNQEKT